MKTILFCLLAFVSVAVISKAQSDDDYYGEDESYIHDYNPRPYEDYYGNSYQYYDNLFKDTDNDGLMNYFDNNDRNTDLFKSLFKSNNYYNYSSQPHNYNSSYYDFNSGRTIYTGPRGGQYYINSNGNKVYIK